jgi:hypothetical protein
VVFAVLALPCCEDPRSAGRPLAASRKHLVGPYRNVAHVTQWRPASTRCSIGAMRPAVGGPPIKGFAAYPAARSSVLSPNGLYGSMGIGGVALALRLRQQWPDILLNETHPKVLAFAFRNERHTDADPHAAIAWFAQHSGLGVTRSDHSGHELDAMLSAWATREGLGQRWPDLVTADPALVFPTGKVTYLWPEFPALESTTIRSPTMTDANKRASANRQTTAIGYMNRNQQKVIRRAEEPGNDQGQRLYVLRCGTCGHEYGANGSDIFQRKCPHHDGGAPGFAY